MTRNIGIVSRFLRVDPNDSLILPTIVAIGSVNDVILSFNPPTLIGDVLELWSALFVAPNVEPSVEPSVDPKLVFMFDPNELNAAPTRSLTLPAAGIIRDEARSRKAAAALRKRSVIDASGVGACRATRFK